MCNSSVNEFPENDDDYSNRIIEKVFPTYTTTRFGWNIYFTNGSPCFCGFEEATIRPEPKMEARVYLPLNYNPANGKTEKARGLFLNGRKCYYQSVPAKPIVMEFTPEELAVIYMVTGKITGGIDDTARKFTEDVYLKICSLWPDLHHISQSGATRGNQVNFHFTRDSFQIVKEIAKKFK